MTSFGRKSRRRTAPLSATRSMPSTSSLTMVVGAPQLSINQSSVIEITGYEFREPPLCVAPNPDTKLEERPRLATLNSTMLIESEIAGLSTLTGAASACQSSTERRSRLPNHGSGSTAMTAPDLPAFAAAAKENRPLFAPMSHTTSPGRTKCRVS